MYTSEPLTAGHDASSFSCGHLDLDIWICEKALSLGSKRVSRAFVWCDSDRRVVAYYALNAESVYRDALPRSFGRGDPDKIPAILLGRLALDKSLQGQGMGLRLLADSYRRVLRASEHVAARYLVVDAIDDSATGFYRYAGFKPTPVPNRLIRKISDIARDMRAH